MPAIAISMQATIFVIAAHTVGRIRPPVLPEDPSPPTSSYPSGHVGAATALYTSFALLAAERIERDWLRRTVIGLCVLMPLLVTFSRLYRGAHHISDVVVGILNGLACALLAYGWYRHRSRETGTQTRQHRATVLADPPGGCPRALWRAAPRTGEVLSEERLSPVAARANPGRAGEDRGPGVLDVLVEGVLRCERPLHGHELRPGVPAEGDEEQPGVEVADAVGAVGEVVAAAQQPDALEGLVRGEADVGSGTAGPPSVAVFARSTVSNSCRWPRGAPSPLVRPMTCSCSCRLVRSQTSMCIRMRRATR